MPWWSVIYLVLFVLLVGVGTWLEAKDRSERPFILVLDSASVIICAYFFVAFWFSSLRQSAGIAAPVLFALAAGWQIYDTPRGVRSCLSDPEVSAKEKPWILAGIIAFILPAYVVAGFAVFR